MRRERRAVLDAEGPEAPSAGQVEDDRHGQAPPHDGVPEPRHEAPPSRREAALQLSPSRGAPRAAGPEKHLFLQGGTCIYALSTLMVTGC